MSTDATHHAVLSQSLLSQSVLSESVLPPSLLPGLDDAMDAVLLSPLQHADGFVGPRRVRLLLDRALAASHSAGNTQTMLASGFGALLATCLLAGLIDPAAAPSLFVVALAASAVQPLVLGRRASTVLTVMAATGVALPPLLRNLWLAAGIPQVVARALLDGQFVSLHSPALRTGQLSPLPAVPGVAGLLLAVVAVAVTSGAARGLRQAHQLGFGAQLADVAQRSRALAQRGRALPQRGRALAERGRALARRAQPDGPLDGPPPTPKATLLSLLPRQRQASGTARRGAAEGDAIATAPDDVPVPLPSRTVLLERITQALGRTDLVGGEVGLFAVQIDRFDALADALGPAAADDLVRQVTRRLRAWLPADDVVARLGAGTFGVLVEGLGHQGVGNTGCDGTARRMTSLLREPMTCDGHSVSVTVSIGIATSRMELASAQALLRAAQEALDSAQRDGRARWVTFDGERRALALAQGTLELDLRRALRDRRIRAAFQPVVRLGAEPGDDRVIAMEALARWTLTDGTAVDPARFLPLAEEIGLGPVLGQQVLQCGLDAVAGWYADDHAVGRLAINLAQSQLDDPHFVATLTAALKRRALPPSCLVVEVAAGTVQPTDQAVATLEALRALGVEVLLDDFGVPGLSLAALTTLPLSGVKLHRSVCATLPVALLDLCRSLGLRCIVEGVETQAELDAARALGVDAVQGFFVGPPARARDVTAMLENARAG